MYRLAVLLITLLCCVALMTPLSADTVGIRFYDNDKLVIVERAVPEGMSPEEAAVRALVEGPTQLEAGLGYSSRIPTDVAIHNLVVTEDAVEVDMSQAVLVDLDEARLLDIFEQFRATLGDFPSITSIRLTCGGEPLASYLPPAPEIGEPAPEPIRTSAVGLAGRKICVGPSHGRFWNGSGWYWQRALTCGWGEAALEDTNSIRLVTFLKQYLVQDGATFSSPRQLDQNDCCNADTGLPWWKMCASTWLHHAGAPGSVWASSSGNYGADTACDRNSDDIRARPLYANSQGADIYISHHTNAGGGGTATGTETFRDSAMQYPAHEANSLALATAVQDSIISTIRNTFPEEPNWANRGVKDSAGSFGEIRIPNRPAILIELAFHDNCSRDALYLTDDFFRSVAEWAIYKGICTYFGSTPTWDKYSCEFVSHDIPTTMEVGQRYTVHVTMRNRGVVWSDARGFRLGAVGDSDPFSTATRQAVSGSVNPGSTHTFTFTLRAPLSVGTYTTEWQMVRDGYQWFGPTVAQTIEVTGIPDTEPPTVPTGLVAAAQNEMRVDLSWNASTDDRGVIGYYIYRNGVKIGSSATTSYSDVTCQPSTTYTYEVTAYDDFMNESGKSAPAEATTPLPSPPTVPQNLRGTGATTSTISLAWDASSDNLGVVGYRVYRNGVHVGTTANTSFTDTGLHYTTSYTYQVDAYDAVPSYSEKSAPVTLSTTTPPYYTWTRTSSNGDCYIRSGSGGTPGNAAGIQTGWSSTASIAARRGLVQWDMTGAPAQEAIVNSPNSVRVKLYCYLRSSNQARNVDLRKVTVNWSEGTATWNSMNANWSGVFATTAVGPVGDYTWSWNGAVLGIPEQNRGVQVYNQAETEASMAKIFTDKEQYGGANPQPRLEIDYYDIVPPVNCSIQINGGAAYTTSPTVTLALSASDFPSGMSQMQFSTDGVEYSTPEPYATSKSYTLTGEGLKTIYVRFRDVSGNWSAAVSDTITVDTVPPTGTISINSGAAYTNSRAVTLNVSCPDAVQMQFCNANGTWSGWQAYAAAANWTLSEGDGDKTVYVRFKDAAGNITTETIEDEIILDTTAPVINSVTLTPRMAAVGDAVHAVVDVDDNIMVSGVMANDTPLVRSDENTWTGDITAIGPVGILQNVTIIARDSADNSSTDSSAAYKSARVVAASTRAAWDGVSNSACGIYLFKFWGKVTELDEDYFTLSDGSSQPVTVHAPGYKAKAGTGDYVTARGILGPDGSVESAAEHVIKY